MDDDSIRLTDDRGTSSYEAALPMRWLAAGIPLTLLIDLAEPGRSREIALHEAADEAPQIRLGVGPGPKRSLV